MLGCDSTLFVCSLHAKMWKWNSRTSFSGTCKIRISMFNHSMTFCLQEMCKVIRNPCRIVELEHRSGWPDFMRCEDSLLAAKFVIIMCIHFITNYLFSLLTKLSSLVEWGERIEIQHRSKVPVSSGENGQYFGLCWMSWRMRTALHFPAVYKGGTWTSPTIHTDSGRHVPHHQSIVMWSLRSWLTGAPLHATIHR
jgi:hypothetical protein